MNKEFSDPKVEVEPKENEKSAFLSSRDVWPQESIELKYAFTCVGNSWSGMSWGGVIYIAPTVKKQGYTKDRCWSLHGKPSRWGWGRPLPPSEDKGTSECTRLLHQVTRSNLDMSSFGVDDGKLNKDRGKPPQSYLAYNYIINYILDSGATDYMIACIDKCLIYVMIICL